MPAPSAEKRPHCLTIHGDTRVDPYYWLNERDNPEVIDHLRAENDYVASSLSRLRPLENTIFAEMKARILETDISVPVRHGGWWYYERTREGLSYPITCRAPVRDLTPPLVEPTLALEGEQVVLDENVEASGHDFLSVGVFSLSPDDEWVAVGTDVTGRELHRVTFRPLGEQEPIDDVLDDVYFGFAWALDARHVFYTSVDDAMRPYRLWRHRLGSAQSEDELIFQEDDAEFNLSVGRSRDDEVVVLLSSSTTSTEVRYVDAREPRAPWSILEARRADVEYSVDHLRDRSGGRWWLMLTNEGARDFRLMARREEATEWCEIVPERPGQRLDAVDAFADFLALSERLDGYASVRLMPLAPGPEPFGEDLLERSFLVGNVVSPSTVGLGETPTYDSAQVRVGVTSLVTPALIGDVDVATGELHVRKQQRVLSGYDPEKFVTGRLWVRASDGVEIPVSLVARADVLDLDADATPRPRGPAPLVLYGYGSYEVSIDPGFSTLRLSLLERGVIFAIAHVRGGGELGRAWYEMGRMAQKPTTFSDFVTIARALVERGFTRPENLAARGASAGGLLMGAVMNLAPELFRCVVAEVPFVDVVTTMLDPSLPLTIGEFQEWGDPGSNEVTYRSMLAYSPYDNVRAVNLDGTPRRYPDVFVTGGLNDSSVGYWEPAKWVLALRDANAENVAYLKTEMGAGHGGPSGRYDAWRDEAQVTAFLLDEISPGSE